MNQMGYLGEYPDPVWLNPNGIGNILSQNEVAQHYHLTMDTAQLNTIALVKQYAQYLHTICKWSLQL